MALTRPHAVFAAVCLCACTTPRTEIIVETSTDMAIPSRVDAFQIDVTGPNGAMQHSTAPLGPSEPPPPRTLGLVYQDGSLGAYEIVAQALHGGLPVVERRASVSFQRHETLVLRIDLDADCIGVSCMPDQTCDQGSCRAVAVGPDELTRYDGHLPGADAAPVPDAGKAPDSGRAPDSGPAADGGNPPGDAGCGMPEVCNGMDDDCDGTIDEGFDLQTDPRHCGDCRTVCSFAHATPTCTLGACVIQSCDTGFDDCDGNADNGCETDLSQPSDCGSCGNACHPPDRSCCSGTCGMAC